MEIKEYTRKNIHFKIKLIIYCNFGKGKLINRIIEENVILFVKHNRYI